MTNNSLGLSAASRQQTGKQVKTLREQGNIPAVLYGHNIEPKNITLKYTDFEKVYKQAGESTLVDLKVDEAAPVKVLIQDYQLDPRINQFLHVDFHQVNMKEKIHTDIPIEFIGEAPAVKNLGAVLIKNMDSFEVECLPQDLVHEIKVDLASLKEFDDSIHVSDIKAPEGITIKNVADDVIALVQAPRTAQDVDDASSAVAAEPAEAEVVGEENKESAEAEDKEQEKK